MGGTSDQITLYAYMDILQLNPFVQLIYTNFKKKERKGNPSGMMMHVCNPSY
jgi:hypothetical protein